MSTTKKWPYPTLLERIEAKARLIEADLATLLLRHSALVYDNPSQGMFVHIRIGDYRWNKLSAEAKRHQGKLLRAYEPFRDLLRQTMVGTTINAQRASDQSGQRVHATISQSGYESSGSVEKVLEETLDEFRDQRAFLAELHSDSECVVVVPDTNAFIAAPALERWSFESFSKFDVVLVPSVLEELDRLKRFDKPELAAKAKRIVRQLHEYMRRGSIVDGVPVVSGKICLRSVSFVTAASQVLPSLKDDHADDRLIAAVIEIGRRNVHVPVLLATSDVNLTNKLACVEMTSIEPPTERAEEPARSSDGRPEEAR